MKKEPSEIISEIYTPQTSKEIKKVEDLLFKHSGPQMRDIWMLGSALGLRINELLQIKFDDFHLDGDKYLLKYTAQKSRSYKASSISISISVPPIIKGIILRIRNEYPNDTYVFQSRNSRNRLSEEPKPVSRQAIYKAFKDVGGVLNEKLTAHSMRRAFVTKLFVNFNKLPSSERSRLTNNVITQHYINAVSSNDKDDQLH